MNRRNPLFWPFWVACALSGLLGLAAFTLPAEPAPAPVVEIPPLIYAYTPAFAETVDARVLAAGVAETVTVPAAKDLVFITYDTGTLYCDGDGVAAAPSGDVTDGTASEILLSGSARRVAPAQTISCVNTSNAKVTWSWATAIKRVGTP